MTKKVAIVGLGYIGLPMACLVANRCDSTKYSVKGVDISNPVIEALRRGTAPFEEPGLAEELQMAINNRKIDFSTKLEKSDIYVVCVPTPFVDDGSNTPDLTYVYSVLNSIVRLGPHSCTVIIESTCPVGTTGGAKKYLLDKFQNESAEVVIKAAYCPERGIPGNTLYEMEHNARLIGGEDEASCEEVREFYAEFIKGDLHVTESKIAEMSKLSENSFRDVNIAFANELALLAKEYGIDPKKVIQFANLHPRVNILSPGIGVGGHCIPVDPWFLISDNPKGAKLLAAARQIDLNTRMMHFNNILKAINERLWYSDKLTVFIWGLSFKPNVDDIRESPAVDISKKVKSYYKDNKRVSIVCVEPHYNRIKDEHNECAGLDVLTCIPDEGDIREAVNIELVPHDMFNVLTKMSNLHGYDACYMGVIHA